MRQHLDGQSSLDLQFPNCTWLGRGGRVAANTAVEHTKSNTPHLLSIFDAIQKSTIAIRAVTQMQVNECVVKLMLFKADGKTSKDVLQLKTSFQLNGENWRRKTN